MLAPAPSTLPPLMFVTDRTLFEDQWAMLEALRRACWHVPPGGVLVQVREKQLEGAELASLTSAIVSVAHSSGQRVVVNDRLDVAKYCKADGVHLPEAGIAVEDAREVWPEAILGRSCHSVEACFNAGRVNYVTLSPVYVTSSKPDAPALGVEAIHKALTAPVSIYALGGIDAEQADLLLKMGAHVAMRTGWRKLAD